MYLVLSLLGPGLDSISFDWAIMRSNKKSNGLDGFGIRLGNFLRVIFKNTFSDMILSLYMRLESNWLDLSTSVKVAILSVPVLSVPILGMII